MDEPEPEAVLPSYVTPGGSTISHISSIPLLAEVCALLPHLPNVPRHQPTYASIDSGGYWITTVKLPSFEQLQAESDRIFNGRRCRSKRDSRTDAAWSACIKLFEVGAIDEALAYKRDPANISFLSLRGGLDADGREIDTSETVAIIPTKFFSIFGQLDEEREEVWLNVLEVTETGFETFVIGAVTAKDINVFNSVEIYDIPDRSITIRSLQSRKMEWGKDEERFDKLIKLKEFNHDCIRLAINRRVERVNKCDILWAPAVLADYSDVDWKGLDNSMPRITSESSKSLTTDDVILVPYRRPLDRMFKLRKVRDDVDSLSSTKDVEKTSTPINTIARKLIEKYDQYFIYVKVAFDFGDVDEEVAELILEVESLPSHIHNHLRPGLIEEVSHTRKVSSLLSFWDDMI
jgi:hypothetical protein